MRRILHVVAGLPVEGGGLSELVPLLALAEARRGDRVAIATRAAPGDILSSSAAAAERGGVRIFRFAPSRPGFLFFSRGMLAGLRGLVAGADAVHVHGNWTFPVWWGCRCAIRCGKRLVMTPHGSFDPVRLRHSGWKKRLAGWIDRRLLRRADVVHATCEAERGWCRAFAGREGLPCVVIPNGTELPPGGAARPAGGRGVRRALFLGRLHPLKGVDLLLEAWRSAAGTGRPGWELVVCGPDERGLRPGFEKQAAALGIAGSVVFRDGVYGAEKWGLIRSADCLVLPTRSENFGIVVAEALACGVPAVCTKGAPWRELETERCGLWCEVSAGGLAGALRVMMGFSDGERAEMGRRGRLLVARRYAWDGVAGRMGELYGEEKL